MRRRSPSSAPVNAYEKAIALLARREHSARELKSKLEQRGLDDAQTEAALAQLQSKDFQSDARFGEMLVRSRLEGGYGARWIIAELRQHGITDTAARDLIDTAEPDWPELVRRQLRRRYGTGKPAGIAERNKRATFLLRRGYDTATVKLVVGESGFSESPDEAD